MNTQKNQSISSSFTIAILMLVAAAMAGLSCQLLLRDCILWTCAPARSFSVLELDLSKDLFPEDARFGIFSQPSELSGAIESAAKSIGWDGGRALYRVQRFSTDEGAERYFQIHIRMTVDTLLKQTRDIEDIGADEAVIQCGNMVYGAYRCYFVGRYQEYLILFFADIDSAMTEADFLEIVHVIDDQTSCKLNQNCTVE